MAETKEHKGVFKFFLQFMAHPGEVGSLIPSSGELAHAVAQQGQVAEADTVIELGPGTGAITEAVLPQLQDGATFVALEINGDFVRLFQKRFPGVAIYEDTAEHARTYLERHGKEACDSVVSGLPWASFPDALQDSLLDAILDVLRPGGRFVTYTYLMSPYLPQGRRFRQKLERRFSDVGRSPMVWFNVPPAFVYCAKK